MEPNATCEARQSFSKCHRLLKRREFLYVQQRGRRFRTDRLIIQAAASPVARTRLGLVISKKVGNAVERNRLKRRLREIFRQNKPAWPEQIDIIVVGQRAAVEASAEALRDDMLSWAQRVKTTTDTAQRADKGRA